MYSLELNHLYLLNEKAYYYNTANVICQVARSNKKTRKAVQAV